MATRNPSKSGNRRARPFRHPRSRPCARGTVSVQMLVLLVPVLFGLMGFAVDLGRLYLIKGELKSAANAMALAAAARLIGTDASTDAAATAARLTLEDSAGFANKYNFGGTVIGESEGSLQSEAPDPAYFETAAGALGEGESEGNEVSGAAAKYARVSLRAEAPLLFWGLLSLGAERKTPVEVSAVAGVSAPLCTACGIEPIAIQAISAEDTVDFGFALNTRYTFGYTCIGQTPSVITGDFQRVNYLLLNRYNEEATVYPEETQQAFRIGAGGMIASANPAYACIRMNSEEGEGVWVTAAPGNCNQPVSSTVRAFNCGLYARFDLSFPDVCTAIPDVDTIATAYSQDTDLANVEEYAAYTGSARRVITVPVVEQLNPGGGMLVLGFRQFLVNPNPESATPNPADSNGRFSALYIGSAVPLRQGRFDGCEQAAGPGKVVLHR